MQKCKRCDAPATIGSLCEKHWLSAQELFRIKPFELIFCKKCGSVRSAGKWQKPVESFDRTIKKIIENRIKSAHKLKALNISFVSNRKLRVTITARGHIPPAKTEKTEKKEIVIPLKQITCPTCIKLSGRYHEAVLQLRGQRTDLALNLIKKFSVGMPLWIEKHKHGLNVYFVDKSDASKIASRLKKEGFSILRSFKFIGIKEGKKIIRDFYAIR
jgi:NMD protein affecting ribosome stability and mRNA decay